MLQTVRVWKRLKALSKSLALYKKMGFKRGAIASLLALTLGITACGDSGQSSDTGPRVIKRMSEVSPPAVVQALTAMNEAQPHVAIVSPRPDTVIDNDAVSIRFRVTDLDLYKDESLGLGPHLNVLVDNEFYQAVYDTTAPLDLEGLTPGTHTIRAIATSAWDESFKNQEAYAQTTFHIFTKTPLTAPPSELPLLTYSQPTNTYGAEPILLDYFFTPGPEEPNSPPQSTDEQIDSITQGWQVRATVNGEPFVFDQWEPIYLQGFKPGKNWIQIELLDENAHPIEGLFNNTARIIQYEPGGDDMLSLLMRDQVSLEEVGTLVDPNYLPPAPEVAEPEEVEETAVGESVIEESLDSDGATSIESLESVDEDSDVLSTENLNAEDNSNRQDPMLEAGDELVLEQQSSDAIAPYDAVEVPQAVESAPSPDLDIRAEQDAPENSVSDTVDEPILEDTDDDDALEANNNDAELQELSNADDIANTEPERQNEESLLDRNSSLELELEDDLSSPDSDVSSGIDLEESSEEDLERASKKTLDSIGDV